MPTIAERIAAAHAGENLTVIAKMPSGWVVLCDNQVLPGWCILLADPVVPTLNDLDDSQRATFLADMARVGDALLSVTGAIRINYAIFGNLDPQLHAHVAPRYADEPDAYRTKPPFAYEQTVDFDLERDGNLMERIAGALRTM